MPITTIDLSKGTDQALLNSSGQPADTMDFSVFWHAKKAAPKGLMRKLAGVEKVDLDLSVICYDAHKKPVAVCNEDETEPFSNKALYHTGDTKSGRSGGEAHETVEATLSKVPQQMKFLAVVLNSYKGHTFESVNQLRLLIEDRTSSGAVEVAENYVSIQGSQNAALMAVLKRTDTGGWTVAPRDHIFTAAGKDWLSIATPCAQLL